MYNIKKKNIIIVVLLMVAVLMSVGYAILTTTLNITNTTTLTGTWGIRISNVTSSATGRAYNITEPTYDDTTMKFNVGVKEPGDKMTFTITIENYGNLGAILESIDASVGGTELIIYSIDGIKNQERLAAGATKTFTISTYFDINATELPTEPTKDLTVTLNYIQDDDQALNPSDPIINEVDKENTLPFKILNANNEQSDVGLNFVSTSEETNTNGLYYTNVNTENNKTVYYFRGNVNNNYVKFGGYIWRIVRINEDGSVRLILNDTIGTSKFNISKDDNAYVGYMYGSVGASTYEETHKNTNDSTIKKVIDSWYEDNLKAKYSTYLADAGFCNDRSVASNAGTWNDADTAKGYGNNVTMYGSFYRTYRLYKPQFDCPNTNDLFTTSSSNKGNKALIYPIGMLTVDEMEYAGSVPYRKNNNYYLYIGKDYYTLSPRSLSSNRLMMWMSDEFGIINEGDVHTAKGVRPVINLKSYSLVSGGTGIEDDPYVVGPDIKQSLSSQVLNDNEAMNDAAVTFGETHTSSSGLYYTNSNTQNGMTTYYFKGNVNNNYIKFGGYIWRIVRINEDGSIRIMLNNDIGTASYDSSNYIGSSIKTKLDTWYESNLQSFASYIADTGFCNDRTATIYTDGKYDAASRLGLTGSTVIPKFACASPSSDLLTVSNGAGTKSLTYPIGTLTADEVVYAGGSSSIANSNFYMNKNYNFWTMTPYSNSKLISWNDASNILTYNSDTRSVVPVINLKATIEMSGGDGTSLNPYIVKTN